MHGPRLAPTVQLPRINGTHKQRFSQPSNSHPSSTHRYQLTHGLHVTASESSAVGTGNGMGILQTVGHALWKVAMRETQTKFAPEFRGRGIRIAGEIGRPLTQFAHGGGLVSPSPPLT